MATFTLTDGWTCGPFRGPFAAIGGPADDAAVSLPHDAMRGLERSPDVPARGAAAYHPGAAVSYRRRLDVPAAWADRVVRLEVQGAFRHAQVFVNDQLAGSRAEGYARFWVDLTPFLVEGANELRIETRAGEDSRWYSGAGLHRPVVLHVDPLIHVAPDGVRVTTLGVDAGVAAVEVAVTVANAGHRTATTRVESAIDAPDGAGLDADSSPVTLAPGAVTTVRHRYHLVDAALWSADSPSLHVATVSLDSDASPEVDPDPRIVPFGIRTVTVDPRRGLRINGESVLLRGACIHHDNGPLGGAAFPRAEERRIALLKEAGFNAIRTAHNPASPAMLDACDRLGMLVMDEAFDMWTRGKTTMDYSLDFPRWWREDLDALVAKDYNHPSVIMYSIGNEIVEVGTPHGAALNRELAEHVRALDPTRPVTNGINVALAVLDEVATNAGLNEGMANPDQPFNALSASESATRRIEESAAALDVVGLNYADSRYALDAELHPHRVLVGSETFPAQIGTLWPLVEEHPHVIGDFTWTGWDYLGEVGIGAVAYAEDKPELVGLEREYPYLTAWCGDLDLTGWRRPVSFYREIVFGLRTEPCIAVRRPSRAAHTVALATPWAWSDTVSSWTWRGFEGAAVAVEVYADADEVVLELDGVEVGRAPVGERMPRVADLDIEYRPGTLVAVALRGGAEVGRTSLVTAAEPALTASADRTALAAGARDLAYVAIELRDAAGVLVMDADVPVTVTVDGAGTLAGMCSANPSTEERFTDATWDTFDGRALAVIEAGEQGEIVVTATAPGMEPARVVLAVR
ncbi:glycoside hydrolase family 2 TIM barrel-domain containing protein [Demequina sp. SYSU T00068]|uniref:glycoside hydrolase family 2 TIM barrel-domain containing protein n=1 Tax=Demequina lignilytica TaxID=3051663 RepID=UPI0026256194|nr:glycoside hydrolase family 2 TIM barrel-domain containing protein [Demequina sp. SYSU T00068]MDN4490294.1 glycoside hydrolase family 2 TIM barrel-domain containing protein [Demequina sp. SYSU T00068]